MKWYMEFRTRLFGDYDKQLEDCSNIITQTIDYMRGRAAKDPKWEVPREMAMMLNELQRRLQNPGFELFEPE